MTGYASRGHDVDVLVTGVGMVATAAWCSRALAARALRPGAQLRRLRQLRSRRWRPAPSSTSSSDRLAELGAEDGDAFLTIQQLQLLGDNEFPFVDGDW